MHHPICQVVRPIVPDDLPVVRVCKGHRIAGDDVLRPVKPLTAYIFKHRPVGFSNLGVPPDVVSQVLGRSSKLSHFAGSLVEREHDQRGVSGQAGCPYRPVLTDEIRDDSPIMPLTSSQVCGSSLSDWPRKTLMSSSESLNGACMISVSMSMVGADVFGRCSVGDVPEFGAFDCSDSPLTKIVL